MFNCVSAEICSKFSPCTMVPGTGQQQLASFRDLYRSPMQEYIRLAILFICSNFYTALAQILTAGNKRRCSLIGLISIFIEERSMVEYGNFDNVAHMRTMFYGDDAAAYARHMDANADASRIVDQSDAYRISAKVKWHQVVPKPPTEKNEQVAINSTEDTAAMHLTIVMLFGACLNEKPSSGTRPVLPEYSAKILQCLRDFKDRADARLNRKQRRENADISEEEKAKQLKRDSTCVLTAYPMPRKERCGAIRMVNSTPTFGEIPSTTLNAARSDYLRFASYFFANYTVASAATCRTGFYLPHFRDKLKDECHDLYNIMKNATAADSRAMSFKWLVEAINSAIDVYNDDDYQKTAEDDRKDWKMVSGLSSVEKGLSYKQKLHSPNNDGEIVEISSVVFGYAASVNHSKVEWYRVKDDASKQASRSAKRKASEM